MSDANSPAPVPLEERTIVMKTVIDATPAEVFKAWTTPDRMKDWFCPKPWTVSDVDLDPRPGGRFNNVMHGPDGEVMPNKGIYLELVPGKKLVFTDAFEEGWKPSSGTPFMVATIELEEAPGGKTNYTATARHWTKETTDQHKQMGFEDGWRICAQQLSDLLSGKA